jgi:hypothetical protein
MKSAHQWAVGGKERTVLDELQQDVHSLEPQLRRGGGGQRGKMTGSQVGKSTRSQVGTLAR